VSGARKLDVMGADLLELCPDVFRPHELEELGKFRYIWFCNDYSINEMMGATPRHPCYNYKDDYDPVANKDSDFVNDSFTLNNGCDDELGNYRFDLGRHIEYRYEVIAFLGKGSFGQVVKCFDHKRDCIVALKMVRNRKRFQQQALAEIKLLEYLMSAQLCVDLANVNDPTSKHINSKLIPRAEDGDNADGTGYGEWTSGYRPCFTMKEAQQTEAFTLPSVNHHHIVRVMGYFYFRGHVCLTFEPLSINLYDFLRLNGYKGASPFLVKRIAVQIIYTLAYLFQHNIVHCDLKPENILFKAYNPEAGSKAVTVNNAYLSSHEQSVPLISTSIKIIDFGSSCFVNESVYTYIQSRFYRAPEIILGAPYSCAIDVWSLGCIIVELFLGYPLFPGDNEEEQMVLLIDTLGVPPLYIQRRGSRSRLYFRSNGEPRPHIVDQLGPQPPEALDPEKNKGKTRVNSILRKMLIRYGYNMSDPRSQQSPVAYYYRSVRSSRGLDPDKWPTNVIALISENEPLMGNLALACLQWDPEMRITPKQALQHRFLTDVDQSCDEFMRALQREMARCVIALNMVAKQ
jgi:serine/threonine protein kinase